MKEKLISIILFIASISLCGCILPKEEELVTTPVIEAYEHDDFKTTKVKKGDLVDKQEIECTVLNINEKSLSFNVEDKSYKGIYVKEGDIVEANTVVAELVADGLTAPTALKLRAPFAGKITYCAEIHEGEKSIKNKRIVTINQGDAYYLSAVTKYWDNFKTGETYDIRFVDKSYPATVIEPEEIGVERYAHTGEVDEEYPIYFKIEDMSACLYSDLCGYISIILGEEKDALYVPSSAVTTINDKEVVFYEDKDGVRNVKHIKTGLKTSGKTQVISGLSEGEVIILE